MTTADARLRLVAADAVPPSVVWRAFVDGFRDYVVPVEIAEGPFAALIASEHVDLSASVVALDPGGDPAGVCLLAIRGRDGWCGGLGVTPSGRRQGLGRRLMASAIDVARARGLARVRLECIVGNTAARDLYLGLGFQVIRRLDLFAGPIREGGAGAGTGAVPVVRELEAPAALWTRFAEYHEVRRPWQHDLPALQTTVPDGLRGLCIGDSARPDAYVLYRSPQGADGPVVIVDSGQLPEVGAPGSALAAILAELAALLPGHPVRAANVPDDDPLNPALRALGVPIPLSQEEMEIDLTGLDQTAIAPS